MNKFSYDSYCGIYCGACDIHHAYKSGQRNNFSSVWSEPVLAAFQKAQGNAGLTSESLQIRCHGCKSDTVFINCKTCKIRSCAIGRKVEHCIDCKEYPCMLHAGMQKLGRLLPHIKNNQPNLDAIKAGGLKQWLGQQEQRWKCPQCQTSFSWYASVCSRCGTRLKGLSYGFSPIKAFLLRFSIRLASLRKPGG